MPSYHSSLSKELLMWLSAGKSAVVMGSCYMNLLMRTRTKPNLLDAAVEHQDKKLWFHFKPQTNLK